MKLLLTSSGMTNKSIENAFQDLLGRPFSTANLVFIPTAANVEEDISGWLKEDINNFKKLGFKSFHVIDIAKGKKDDWWSTLNNADIIVFGGGNEEYLLEQIRKAKLESFLTEFVKAKVYVGISAGSMVTARRLSLNDSGNLYYERFDRQGTIDGLGYVDFEIRPHLNSSYFSQVTLDVLEKLAPEIKHTFYAIDDDTAIQVVDGRIDVISEGEWKKFD